MLFNVKKMNPWDRLTYWIEERESIRLKRLAGKGKPWTDDPILQSYRFCNVRRMDDKVSDWLYQNWYKPYHSHPNMIPAVVVARHFNNVPVLELLTDLMFAELSVLRRWREVKDAVKTYRELGNPVFSGAYIIRADGEFKDKVDMVIDQTVDQFLTMKLVLADTMKETHERVLAYRNFGSFMAGQVVADLRWATSIGATWKDAKTWAPIGPGSARGLKRLNGLKPNALVQPAKLDRWLADVIEKLSKTLPRHITSRCEAIDYQNQLCEYDKYVRALDGEGKPKQKYAGGGV